MQTCKHAETIAKQNFVRSNEAFAEPCYLFTTFIRDLTLELFKSMWL